MTYAIVLIIVIAELVFAFGIGISCVIFSTNLVKAVRRENGELDDGPVRCASAVDVALMGTTAEIEADYNTFSPVSSTGDVSSENGSVDVADLLSAEPTVDAQLLEGDMNEFLAEDSEISLLEGALRNFTDYLCVW